MKQVMIIMSLVFSVFILSGCKNTEKDCKEKGAGWVWDIVKKKCVAIPKSEEDCSTRGKGWIWTAKKECIYIISGITPYVTIVNSTNRSISYGSDLTFFTGLLKGECHSMTKKEFNVYSASFQITTGPLGTELVEGTEAHEDITICESGSSSPCPSSKGVYEVQLDSAGFVIAKMDKTLEELIEMGCFDKYQLVPKE